MHDARDVEDQRLLETGDHKLLVSGYFHPVRERCFLRLRDRDKGDEAAQLVFVRLLAELERGKRYPVPFRVVVRMVTDWTLQGFYPGTKQDDSLPEGWDPAAPDAWEHVDDRLDFDEIVAGLPPREREVVDLLYRESLSHEQIADRLGVKRNAVDQALHRAHRKLAEKLRV
jgi:RNA polymerase sigma factor (sigma-70 family)